MKLQKDLREFIELLNSKQVEYLIVGGHAVAFHGYPRYTGDIDFYVRASPANARRLLEVLSAFGFSKDLTTEDFETPGRIEVAYIGKDALLKNKRASGRAKDLADVEQIDEP